MNQNPTNFENNLLDRVLIARKSVEDDAVSSTNLGGEGISVEDATVSRNTNILNKT